MCGYIGKISLNTIDTESLNQANEIQICRGPDETRNLNLEYKDKFNISLIFNRLAIIDLDVKASQPMYSKEHNTYLLFNGEIFNFIELRKELELKGEKFRSDHSDSEVLLLGISKYGTQFLEKCNGQFSFFYVNLNTGKVILCRDRLGQKPLFYKFENSIFYLSLLIIFAIGLSLFVYYNYKTKKLIGSKKSLEKIEDEFSSAIFQLGNLISQNIPTEAAFAKMVENTKGSEVNNFFSIILTIFIKIVILIFIMDSFIMFCLFIHNFD